MKCNKNHMLLYAVTSRAWTGEHTLLWQVEQALKGGVTCVQLREKHADPRLLLEEARQMAQLCRQYRVPFIINDDVELALACGADGVHVGQQDLSARQVRRIAGDKLLVGVSAHSVQEALQAAADGADYLGVGAMFATSTKADARPLPHQTLREICQAVDLPVVAIGGIQADNLLQLTGCGADGVALVSAIFSAQDIQAQCRHLRALSQQMIQG